MSDDTRKRSWWEGRPRRVQIVIFVVAVLAFILIWYLLPPFLYAGTSDEATRVKAITDTRTALLAGPVGIGALGTFWLNSRNFRLAEENFRLAQKTQEHTITDAAERRITELYSKAVDQLGSEHAPVRLGGLYALERLAQAAPTQRPIFVNVLCAYLRMPYDPEGGSQPADWGRAARQEREVRLAAQRILFSHLRSGDPEHAEPQVAVWRGISLDLSDSYLIDVDVRGCHMPTTNWARATLSGRSTFTGATFTGDTSFAGTTFAGETSFTEVTFSRLAQFRDATFTGFAQFNGTTFNGASFRTTQFSSDADFHLATFNRGEIAFSAATFHRGADFRGGTFRHASSFRETTFETGANFDGARAIGGAPHVWPPDWKLSNDDISDVLLALIPIPATDGPDNG